MKSWFAGTASSVNSEIITPFSNAEQIIYKYNQAIEHNSLTQQGWQRLIAQCDDGLASYLTNIKGSTASMSAYSVSLQGNITGYTKITQAMKQYNALGAVSQKEQQNFATAISLTNTKLGSYLTGLNGAKASLGGYGVSLIASTAKTVGLAIATTALNAALTFGISAIITGVVSAFATWINSSKKITEAAEEAKDKISSINDDLKTNTETVENAKQRYAELAQEVENLGQVSQSRGSLSTDEYEEFLDLSNQLAGVFPQLTKGYDDNGNAILDLSGNVDAIVGSLDDLLQKEKDLANQKIMDEFPDVYKGYVKDLEDAESEVESAKKKFDDINSAYSNLDNGQSIQMGFLSTGYNKEGTMSIGQYESWLETLGLTYEETVVQGGKVVSAVGDINDAFTSQLETARKNLQYAEQQLEGEKSSIDSYLNTWLQSEFTYNQIDDSGLQTAVQDMIMNFDFSSLPKDKQNNWDYVSEYLRRNILFAINDVQDDPEISKAISEVFTNQDLTPDKKANYLQQIKDYFDNLLGKDNAISISLQPQIEDTGALQKSIEKTADRFNDSDKIKDFFDTEGINTDKEVNDFNKVTEGINDADKAIQTWNEHKKASEETPISPTSFEDAWTALDSTDKDEIKTLKKDLLEAAEAGQLSAEKFNELDKTEYFKNLGISADSAIRKINGLVNASTQLSSMSAQISKMSDMLAEKKKGNTASASDLAGFDATVRGLESWDQFEKVMGNSKSSMKECQKAANALATEWVNDGNFLSRLTEENKQMYITQLDQMGVSNAQAVVTDALARKHEEEAIEEEYAAAASQYNAQCKDGLNTVSSNLTEVTAGEITRLQQEGIISADTAEKISALAVKKAIANGATLDTSGDIRNLANLAGAATQLGRLLTNLAKIKDGFTNGMPSDVAAKQVESYQKQIDELINGGSNKNISASPKINISPTGSSGYKDKSKGKDKSKSKESKTEIDWIERKLDRLQTKIDATKAKFDNLFKLTSPKNLSKNINKVTKSLSSAQSKADSFKKKMNAIKLDNSIKKKAQKGTVKLSNYSKDNQKRIKQYQKYYSSYEKYASKVKNLQKQLNTLNSSRGKINNLEIQIKQMKALESATSKAIKKYESYASKVTLSKSLRNKVKNGDYIISNYDSKTQDKIQKYQNYIDKITELRQQLQKIKGDIKDTKIQEYQLRVDDADAKRSKSEAWTDLERVDSFKKINSHLEYQKKQVKESYKWQIKVAKAEGDSVKASQLRAEREKELRDLTKQEFDAIASAYDYQLKLNDAKRQGIQDALSLAETRGDQIGSAYYSSQIGSNNSDLNTRYKERERLLKKLSGMKKGSEEWYDAYDTLQGINKEISSLINNNAELDRKIKQLKWDRFDELKNKIDDVITEASFLSDLLDSDNFFDDNGMITNDGVTAMGLALQNYDSYIAEAQKYGEQLAKLEADYAAKNISYDDYTSMLREYTQGQQNAIKSANDLKKTTISYVKQGLDAQNEALSKEIEQRKKLLEQEKDGKDFNDKTLDQNKKIARLKRQIAILENDDSDSNRKTLRELRSQLQDVEKEQSDSFYDKSISDQEDALDNMLENSKKQAEEYLKDTDKVFADAIVYVNAHADQVSNTLTKLAQDTGYNISEHITKAWKGSGDAVGDYASTMSENIPKITQQIALITSAWEAQCLAADKAAKASVKATQSFYREGSGSGSGNTNNTNSNNDSAKDIKNYITKHLDKAGKSKSYYGALNQYLYSKTGGKVLSKSEEVQLAKMLGVSVKNDLSGKNDRQKILDALKKKNIKFANGGILGDLVKVSGEDGLFIGSAGESVLTKEQTQALMKFAPIVPQMSNFMDNMKNVVPVNNSSRTENPINIDISNNVNGAVSQETLNEMKKIATNQAETVIKKINSATYAKGVRRM